MLISSLHSAEHYFERSCELSSLLCLIYQRVYVSVASPRIFTKNLCVRTTRNAVHEFHIYFVPQLHFPRVTVEAVARYCTEKCSYLHKQYGLAANENEFENLVLAST